MYFITRINLILILIGMTMTCCLRHDHYPDTYGQEIRDCFIRNNETNTINIITWNVHQLPVHNEEILTRFSSMVSASGADILALQETGKQTEFSKLLAAIPEYDGYFYGISEQNPAFLVKKGGPLSVMDINILFEEDLYAFPRPPLAVSLSFPENDTIYMINVHLKCCEGSENEKRRMAGLNKLKQYTDSLLEGKMVIILGDFNEELTGDMGKIVFREFILDSLKYWFADMSIAAGPVSNWSYPIWPSHLDHFLLSDEWRKFGYTVNCLKPDLCDSTYFATISDHRPQQLGIHLEGGN